MKVLTLCRLVRVDPYGKKSFTTNASQPKNVAPHYQILVHTGVETE